MVQVFSDNKHQRKDEENIVNSGRDLAILNQFSTEFHVRQNRTAWDVFIDGLNRLPRPLITLAILSFFIIAPLYPEHFRNIAASYELMPSGFWALISIIISFYFGGRMQLKSQDMKLQANAVQAAKDLVVMRKEFREIDVEEASAASKLYDEAIENGKAKIENKVVKLWKEEQKKRS